MMMMMFIGTETLVTQLVRFCSALSLFAQKQGEERRLKANLLPTRLPKTSFSRSSLGRGCRWQLLAMPSVKTRYGSVQVIPLRTPVTWCASGMHERCVHNRWKQKQLQRLKVGPKRPVMPPIRLSHTLFSSLISSGRESRGMIPSARSLNLLCVCR